MAIISPEIDLPIFKTNLFLERIKIPPNVTLEHQTKQSKMPQHGFFTRDLAPHLLPGHGGMVPLSDTVRARNVVTACEIGALRAGTSCSELTLNLKTCEVKSKLLN